VPDANFIQRVDEAGGKTVYEVIVRKRIIGEHKTLKNAEKALRDSIELDLQSRRDKSATGNKDAVDKEAREQS
tara:strand:- start:67 stop:285 length:219 start_codon:yes stop_codon:yes gene_type:complete